MVCGYRVTAPFKKSADFLSDFSEKGNDRDCENFPEFREYHEQSYFLRDGRSAHDPEKPDKTEFGFFVCGGVEIRILVSRRKCQAFQKRGKIFLDTVEHSDIRNEIELDVSLSSEELHLIIEGITRFAEKVDVFCEVEDFPYGIVVGGFGPSYQFALNSRRGVFIVLARLFLEGRKDFVKIHGRGVLVRYVSGRIPSDVDEIIARRFGFGGQEIFPRNEDSQGICRIVPEEVFHDKFRVLGRKVFEIGGNRQRGDPVS